MMSSKPLHARSASLQARIERLKEASLARHRCGPPHPSHDSIEDAMPGDTAVVQNDCPDIALPTQERALRLLGLGSSPPASEHGAMDEAPSLHLLRLRAVKSLLQTSQSLELYATSRRLRQTSARLVFHAHNASCVVEHSKRNGNADPWLPAASGASKHRAINRDTKPKKIAWRRISAQTSEMQVKLLVSLQQRLWLKLGFDALRQAAKRAKLRAQLVQRIFDLTESDCVARSVRSWKIAALPGTEMQRSVQAFERHKSEEKCLRVLRAWRTNVAARLHQEQALQRGLSRHNTRLLGAALAGCRLVASRQRVHSLRNVVASAWQDAWGMRKAMLAWRRAARRTAGQKKALMLASGWCAPYHGGTVAAADNARLRIHSDKDSLPNMATALRQTVQSLSELTASLQMAVQAHLELKSLALRWQRRGGGRFQQSATPSRLLCEAASNDTDLDVDDDEEDSRPLYDPNRYASPRKGHRDTWVGHTVDAVSIELMTCRDVAAALASDVASLQQRLTDAENSRSKLGSELSHACSEIANAKDGADAARREVESLQASVVSAKNELELAEARLASCQKVAQSSRRRAAESLEASNQAHKTLEERRHDVHNAVEAADLWRAKLTTAAQQLGRSSSTASKPAVALKLQEVRNRLEDALMTGEIAQKELPTLIKAMESAMEESERADTSARMAEEAAEEAACRHRICLQRLQDAEAQHDACEAALYAALNTVQSTTAHLEALEEEDATLYHHQLQWKEALALKTRELELVHDRVGTLEERHAAAVAIALDEAFPLSKNAEWMNVLSPPPLPLLVLESGRDGAHRDAIQPPPQLDAAVLQLATDRCAACGDVCHDGVAVHVDDDATSVLLGSCKGCSGTTVSAAARYFHRARVLRRTLLVLKWHNQRCKDAGVAATLAYERRHLFPTLLAWRKVSDDSSMEDAVAITALRLKHAFGRWLRSTRRCIELRGIQSRVMQITKRNCLTASFSALRLHNTHQKWHQQTIALLSHRRVVKVLHTWQAWAQERTRHRALLEAYTNVSHHRRLSEALLTWRNATHARTLLRRVFHNAATRWSLTTGASLYEQEYSLLQRCFAAWQLTVHVEFEQQRDVAFVATADVHRGRRLMEASMCALRWNAQRTREREQAAPLARASLVAWRLAVYDSEANALAQRFRQLKLRVEALKALRIWRRRTERLAVSLSLFVAKWREDWPLILALRSWKSILLRRRQWEARRAHAAALQGAVAASSRGLQSLTKDLIADAEDIAAGCQRLVAAGVMATPGSECSDSRGVGGGKPSQGSIAVSASSTSAVGSSVHGGAHQREKNIEMLRPMQHVIA